MTKKKKVGGDYRNSIIYLFQCHFYINTSILDNRICSAFLVVMMLSSILYHGNKKESMVWLTITAPVALWSLVVISACPDVCPHCCCQLLSSLALSSSMRLLFFRVNLRAEHNSACSFANTKR